MKTTSGIKLWLKEVKNEQRLYCDETNNGCLVMKQFNFLASMTAKTLLPEVGHTSMKHGRPLGGLLVRVDEGESLPPEVGHGEVLAREVVEVVPPAHVDTVSRVGDIHLKIAHPVHKTSGQNESSVVSSDSCSCSTFSRLLGCCPPYSHMCLP